MGGGEKELGQLCLVFLTDSHPVFTWIYDKTRRNRSNALNTLPSCCTNCPTIPPSRKLDTLVASSSSSLQVFVAFNDLKNEEIKAESEIKGIELLISEAFSEIDKAQVKGTLHKNTAARRKARLSRAKRTFLESKGLLAALN